MKTRYAVSFKEAEGNSSNIAIEVADQEGKVVQKNEYPSLYDAASNIGRERILGRMEWVLGCGLIPIPFLQAFDWGFKWASKFPILPEPDWGRLAFGFGLIVVGAVIKTDGERRLDIGWALRGKLRELKLKNFTC